MNIKGKKILFLGDSITEGCGATAGYGYVDVFGRLSGAEVFNYGIGGTRISKQTNPTVDNPIYDNDFLGRVEKMNAEADVVVVFGGTNDFDHGDATLGCFTDKSEYTFYGALHSIINKLVNRYPRATIMFMTPLHRLEETVMRHDGERHLSDYVKAIREVCEYYSIPVLDLFATAGLQPKIDIIREIYMPDGLHPSNDGAAVIASRLFGYLTSL